MSAKTESFAALVKRARKAVNEALDAGGRTQVDENTAEPLDWIRVLMENTADIALECRYDLSDPETNAAVRRRLAELVATCQAWDAQLN